ncbi:LolA family protein [Bacillus gobiensis]|uniref:Sporulation protein n=1 Tax=Bacillus gobiensis TaxID=1441095 RepID=A0A0M5JF34_9BACI|nr:outer membrane lipoprotein carrier protein LolA [Bacillus gobiensis]ALC83807.1 sporulation protein [Bacillus gobiensis]
MRKSFVLLFIGLLGVILLSACGQKSQDEVVNGLEKKVKEYTSYKATAKMVIETGEEPQEYKVEIWHKKPDYYRVYLENSKKDQHQVILRNGNGVFVLTPSLNKSFRFQSDWPTNSSQVYLFDSLVNDIKKDTEAEFSTNEENYVFETKTNYQHNQSLPVQEIVLNKKNLAPKSVKVMDTDRKEMVKVDFEKFAFDEPLEKESFDEKKNMTLSHMDIATSAEASDDFAVAAPVYLPEGTEKLEEKEISTADGKRIITTYGGKHSFTLIQEKARVAQSAASVTASGNPVDLGFAIGALTDNSVSWTYDGVEYLLASDNIEQEELVQIAKSVYGQSTK